MNKLGQLYFDAAGGNHNAVVFITAFHAYCHAIDDLIDGDVPFTPEAFMDVLMQANSLYSTPFYIDNWFRLQPVIAQLVSGLRAPKSREGYEAIGGGSPLRKITEEQAGAPQPPPSSTAAGAPPSCGDIYLGTRARCTLHARPNSRRDVRTHGPRLGLELEPNMHACCRAGPAGIHMHAHTPARAGARSSGLRPGP